MWRRQLPISAINSGQNCLHTGIQSLAIPVRLDVLPIQCICCVCVCGEGGINALEFRQGSMKRNYMMELMSQGHGDVKAGEIGHSRNKTRMEKQTLDEADSKYRGKGVIELER